MPQSPTHLPLADLLARFETGARPRGGARGVTGGIPSIGGEHLDGDGGLRLHNLRYVPEAFAKAQSKGWIEPGDVLIVKDGATTGKTVLVRSDFPFARALANEHVFVCRPQPSVHPAYLYYFLRSPLGQRQIRAEFRGAAQGGITRSIGRNVFVPMVPMPEQLAIVGFINEQHTRIQAGRAAIQSAETKIKKLRASFLVSLFKDRRWPLSRIGDIASVHIGATPSRVKPEYWNGDVPWVSSGEVRFRRITSTRETISRLGLERSSTEIHPVGTVLLAMIGEGKTRGQAAILGIPAANNQNAAAIRVTGPDVLPEWIFHCLAARYDEMRMLGSGNNQPALNKARVADLVIPVPDIDTQRFAVERAEAVLSVIDSLESAAAIAHSRSAVLEDRMLTAGYSKAVPYAN